MPLSRGEFIKATQILGLPPSGKFTADDVRSAHRRLMQAWHPDHNPDLDQEANSYSKDINNAKDQLLRWLKEGGPATTDYSRSQTKSGPNESRSQSSANTERQGTYQDNSYQGYSNNKEQNEKSNKKQQIVRGNFWTAGLSWFLRRSARFKIIVFALLIIATSFFKSMFVHPADPSVMRENSARKRIKLASTMFFPLERQDIPEPCSGNLMNTQICKGAIDEVRLGGFGTVRCGYYDKDIDKTWNYFFWSKRVPQSNVKLAQSDPHAAIRALGRTSVDNCPETQEGAEIAYRKANQEIVP